MDDLIGQFTKETGIAIEQQRIVWADLYPKLQVSTPAGEGPDLALIHTSKSRICIRRHLEPIDPA